MVALASSGRLLAEMGGAGGAEKPLRLGTGFKTLRGLLERLSNASDERHCARGAVTPRLRHRRLRG